MIEQLKAEIPKRDLTIASIGNGQYTHSTNEKTGTWSGFAIYDEPVILSLFGIEYLDSVVLEDLCRHKASQAYQSWKKVL